MCCHLPGNCDACKSLEFTASSGMHLYTVARSVSVGSSFHCCIEFGSGSFDSTTCEARYAMRRAQAANVSQQSAGLRRAARVKRLMQNCLRDS